jgi:transposase-like protein
MSQEFRREKRIFSPEQKAALVFQVDQCRTIKEGCEQAGIHYTLYIKWKKQLQLGIKSSLRNSKPQIDPEKKALLDENKRLKNIILNLTAELVDVKKIVSY